MSRVGRRNWALRDGKLPNGRRNAHLPARTAIAMKLDTLAIVTSTIFTVIRYEL